MSILLLLLAANPATDAVLRDRVDLVEVNHYFDASGNLTFDQVIWWELQDGEYRVVDWRILHGVRAPSQPHGAMTPVVPEFLGGHATPIYCHRRRCWSSRWYDEKAKLHREVRASAYRETWTQIDPELLDRDRWPHSGRRRLARR